MVIERVEEDIPKTSWRSTSCSAILLTAGVVRISHSELSRSLNHRFVYCYLLLLYRNLLLLRLLLCVLLLWPPRSRSSSTVFPHEPYHHTIHEFLHNTIVSWRNLHIGLIRLNLTHLIELLDLVSCGLRVMWVCIIASVRLWISEW